MSRLKRILGRKKKTDPSRELRTEVEITVETIDAFPSFAELRDQGKIVPDANGRFRYQHGAPVGKLILVRVNKNGDPIYKERADEWFDPDSARARDFVWPK